MNIVVAGWAAPLAAAPYFWHYASYVLGFTELGHNAWLLDDPGDYPWGWDPVAEAVDPECRAGRAMVRDEMSRLGLGDRWFFRQLPDDVQDGLDRAAAADVLAEADVFVNVSCTTPMRPEYRRIPCRIAIDTDPVFTQLAVRKGERPGLVDDHTRLFTFGRPPLPAQEHEWVPTRQPVAVRHWPVADVPSPGAPLTTVTTWQAYRPTSWDGIDYAGKDRSWLDYLDLPSKVAVPLHVALGGGEELATGRRVLREHGWGLLDTRDLTRSTATYRSFIAASLGELAVAKHAYVRARSGWFSERSCCYLASGRPVVLQNTGFGDWLPMGDGLLAFSTPAEAVAAVEAVAADPVHHAAAARKVVTEHFDAATVCADLLEQAL